VKNLPDDLHVLTGSYALDALGASEREEFERHLQTCPSCDAEVRGLRETAARLAMARAVAPPARMEQRVLAATYQTRQLPPLTRHRASRERRSQVEKLFAPRDSGTSGPPSGRRSGRPSGRFSWAPLDSWPRRIAVAAAAASVAAAAVLGVAQVSTQHQLDSVRASGAAIARVVTAADARVETGRSSKGGSVIVVTSAQLREAVVSATGMAALPSGRVYQAWVMSPAGTPSSARSVGLLQDTQLLAHAVTPGDRIGITVEPPGGTTQPTTTPVAVLPT
jgi:anti-sigma factor RsiW